MKVDYRRADRAFFAAAPAIVAKRLLGCLLVRDRGAGKRCSGRIVETEAYLSRRDPASHSHRGSTRRNASMFGPPGLLYVYAIHAKHCLNLVTEADGIGSAVLVRAIEPFDGVETMQRRRGQPAGSRRLTSGPAMVCQALDVGIEDDGRDTINDDTIWIETPVRRGRRRITATSRIGISQATERPLRFFLDGNYYVSGPRRDHRSPIPRPRPAGGASVGSLPARCSRPK